MTNLRENLKSRYKEEEARIGVLLKGNLASFLKIDASDIKLDNIYPTPSGVRARYSVEDLNFDLNYPEETIDIVINGSPIRVKNLVDIGRILQIEDNKKGR